MAGLRHWVIEDGKIREGTLAEWAAMMECVDRCVGETYVGDVRISTAFMGLDMGFVPGVPVLYETMVFAHGKVPALHPGFWSDSMWRCETMEQAVKIHALAVERVREFLTEDQVKHEAHTFGEILDKGRYADILLRWEDLP